MSAQEYEVTIEIIGTKPPPAGWAARGVPHLGIQHGKEVLDWTAADGKRVVFRPVLRARRHTDGSVNFLGPFAQGPRTERFIYLNWLIVDQGVGIACPGRIKLHLSHIPWRSVESAASAGKPIKVSFALSNASGKPVFASVRADVARWTF